MCSAFALVAAVLLNTGPARAQTTNLIIYNFNTNQVSQNSSFPFGGAYQGWGNWFGSAFQSVAWDPTTDSSNNPNSGSIKVSAYFDPPNSSTYYQYVLFDGFFSENLDMFDYFTNISFDIKFDPTSCTRTNADGTVDFGAMRFGCFDNYNQDWIYYFAIPATNGLGQPNTNWTHVSIPIDQKNTFAFWPNLVTLSGLLLGEDASGGGNLGNAISVGGIPLSPAGAEPTSGNTNQIGTQLYWVDNIQVIGPVGGVVHPPPTMSVAKTTRALRAFMGSASIYARSQLTTVSANESWIGGSFPVTYSFKLLDFPNVNQIQTHLEIIPGPAYTGNTGADYGNTNCLWLQILSDGNGGYTADVSWKTNNPNNNPNHTELSIASTNSPAGTWTLTFNSATSGTLSGPGTNNVAFTINDPNVANDFGNPATLVVGNQPNGVTGGEGLPTDYASITVSGTSQAIADNFTTASSLDPLWTTANCDDPTTVQLITSNEPYWVYWTVPDRGYGLGVATNVTTAPLMLPQYYNGYFDDPILISNGKLRWALIPSDCLPTADGQPQNGQPLAPNAFFRLSDPAPAN